MNLYLQILLILLISIVIIIIFYINDVNNEKNKIEKINKDVEEFNNNEFKETEEFNSQMFNKPITTSFTSEFQQMDKQANLTEGKGEFEIPKFDNLNTYNDVQRQMGVDTSGYKKFDKFIGFNRTGVRNQTSEEETSDDENEFTTQRGYKNGFQSIQPRISTYERLHGPIKKNK